MTFYYNYPLISFPLCHFYFALFFALASAVSFNDLGASFFGTKTSTICNFPAALNSSSANNLLVSSFVLT